MVTLFDQERIMEIHDYHVAEDARKDGLQQGTLQSIQNLIKNMGLSVERAMSVLGISEADRPKYEKCFIPINSERWASGYREIAADFLWGILSKYLHSYYLVLRIEYPFLERLLDGGVPPPLRFSRKKTKLPQKSKI